MKLSHLSTLITSFLLLLGAHLHAQDLTIPPKNYIDSIDTEHAIKTDNASYPLSDQTNQNNWKLLTAYSDEFDGEKVDEAKWYPNNRKWKGRASTYFHGSNVSLEQGELVIRVNQHGDEIIPDKYTHTTGFIKSKNKFLYGYFEMEGKLMDAPWVSGFWMTNRLVRRLLIERNVANFILYAAKNASIPKGTVRLFNKVQDKIWSL